MVLIVLFKTELKKQYRLLKKYNYNQTYKNTLKNQDYCTLIREKNKTNIYSIATRIDNFPFAGVAITNVETTTKESEIIAELFEIRASITSSLSNS